MESSSVDLSKISFDHLQFYVFSLEPIETYLALQDKFNDHAEHLAELRKNPPQNLTPYNSCNQDLVRQLICGFGFRISGHYEGATTRNIMVTTSPDKAGSQFLITAAHEKGSTKVDPKDPDHFQAKNVAEFIERHHGHQGCGVLVFRLESPGAVEEVFNRYKKHHPKLLRSERIWTQKEADGEFKYIEAYAYYLDENGVNADMGTVFRFVEKSGSFSTIPLPGINLKKSQFPKDFYPSFNDHWVSNVWDRIGFLKILSDVLDFNSKVDFNAGVVAAGEAVIDSTVTGNTPKISLGDKHEALSDQNQIYLPINHALSEHGHVFLYLKEIGQGIQHIASRVEDLTSFVDRANEYRNLTGEGFSFLRIPRSYYGRLTDTELLDRAFTQAQVDEIKKQLINSGLMDTTGVVKMDITDKELEDCLSIDNNKNEAIQVIKKSRYINMYKLLRDNLDEKEYLRISKNQILVDIQGGDILYQIFTSNILQESSDKEAPFLEFIQRTCQLVDVKGNKKPIQPGCGGFGIRNFLTLFLSVEITKYMNQLEAAQKSGDEKNIEMAKKMIEIFTRQLEVSNPILTSISDAMTEEGRALEELASCPPDEKEKIKLRIDEYKKIKEEGQQNLMKVSDEHKQQASQIRKEYSH